MTHGETFRPIPDTSDDPLMTLVRLLARQAARENASAISERRLSTCSGEDKNHEPENRTPLLKIADVATYCSVSEKTVRLWVARDKLAVIKLGTQWRIRPRDLDCFLQDRLTR